MFSRYTNYNVPKNYSGNRFQSNDAYETSTKTHTYDEYGAVSSSVSPTYEERITATNRLVDSEVYVEDEVQDITEENSSVLDNPSTDQVARTETSPSVLETLGDAFSKISSEDLLILCIIIFLSTDKSFNNNEIIILLALLLIYN